MARKGKESATQRTLHRDLTLLYEADSQGPQEPEQQEVAETPVKDTMERPSETQTEVAIDPTEEGRGPVGDLAENLTVSPVGVHGRQLTGGAQSRLH